LRHEQDQTAIFDFRRPLPYTGTVRSGNDVDATMIGGCPGRAAKETLVDGTHLKAVQEPLKEKYRNDPGSALITLRAEGRASGLSCKVETGKALIEAGLHPATGGDGTAACSGDMLLEALVACAGVTLRAVATSIGIDLRDAKVLAEGDLDFRGTLGVSKDAPVGFVKIRLRFDVDTDASEEQTATLLKLTERYCVVLQTLRAAPEISARITRASVERTG
jgi:uncharacterized OsmC-like protein